MFEVDIQTEQVKSLSVVQAALSSSVGSLKKMLERKFKFPAATMRLATEKYYTDHALLSSSSTSLKMEGFYRFGKIYVEPSGEEEKLPFSQTKFFSVLDSYAHSITLHITLPPSRSSSQPSPLPNDGKKADAAGAAAIASASGKTGAVQAKKAEDSDGSASPAQASVSSGNGQEKEKSAAPAGKEICLTVDKRITVASFKDRLSEIIDAPSDTFKLYRTYPNGQEFEVTHLTDTLSQYNTTEAKMLVRMGRALRMGEVRIKLFLLKMRETEYMELLVETIVAKGMTVAQLKKQLVEDLKVAGSSVQLDPDRIRIRKKSWKEPRTVLLDHQNFDQDIIVYPGWEAFVQELFEEDPYKSNGNMALFVRHWKPSTHTLGAVDEIVIADNRINTMKTAISELSGIPAERIDFAKARASFPGDTNVLEVEEDVDWNPAVSHFNQYPFYHTDDGMVIYYRDHDEPLQKLTEEQRLELQKQETARLQRSTARSTYTYSRKEKPLKIYTDGSKPSSDNDAY